MNRKAKKQRSKVVVRFLGCDLQHRSRELGARFEAKEGDIRTKKITSFLER